MIDAPRKFTRLPISRQTRESFSSLSLSFFLFRIIALLLLAHGGKGDRKFEGTSIIFRRRGEDRVRAEEERSFQPLLLLRSFNLSPVKGYVVFRFSLPSTGENKQIQSCKGSTKVERSRKEEEEEEERSRES